MIWLDHVVRIVPDFAATERRFRDKFVRVDHRHAQLRRPLTRE
jgi:hypothetical protein